MGPAIPCRSLPRRWSLKYIRQSPFMFRFFSSGLPPWLLVPPLARRILSPQSHIKSSEIRHRASPIYSARSCSFSQFSSALPVTVQRTRVRIWTRTYSILGPKDLLFLFASVDSTFSTATPKLEITTLMLFNALH